MNNSDYIKIEELFYKYGSNIIINVEENYDDGRFIGSAMQYNLQRDLSIELSARFRSPFGFKTFTQDMIRLSEMLDEDYLRRENPALQNAWDEYQMILRLTK